MSVPRQGQGTVPSILVVDDDARGRRLLEGYLQSEGYRIRSAADGPEALELIHRETPDVVLLDVMMPGMSGLEVCRAIKSHPDTRSVQVMMVTALDGTAHRVEGLDTGADDYVTKPARREEFLAKIRALLRARKLVIELEGARSELAARNRELELKKTLAQTLVHDLKNPLTAILGNLHLIEDRNPGGEADGILERCTAAASRMHKMILDLLDVEGLEDGKFVLDKENVDARKLAEEAVEEASVVARSKDVRVVMRKGLSPCPLHVDSGVMRRVLDNLISNAVAHSPKGGTVTVVATTREEGVELTVADEGPGVPKEFRESIFDKYARLTLRDSGITANRGLGLTFCRLAVEGHGGTIWTENRPEGGALFHVLLPEAETGRGGVALTA